MKPLKNKNSHLQAEAFKEILTEIKEAYNTTPNLVFADNEYNQNNNFKKLSNDYHFKYVFTEPYEKYKTAIVERVIQTLRKQITLKNVELKEQFLQKLNFKIYKK